MTKKIMQYRICDKCSRDTEAVVSERIGFNGETFSLDLCQSHSDELNDDLMSWAKVGTKIGTTNKWDAKRIVTGPTLVSVEPLRKPPTVIDVREPEPVTVTRRQLPSYPMTAARWNVTHHAKERLDEREISIDLALFAAEAPELTRPSRYDQDCELRTRNQVTVVVDPVDESILTVYTAGEPEDDQVARPVLTRTGTHA